MPVIPDYNTLSRNTPQSQRGIVSIDGSAKGAALDSLGQTMQNIGASMMRDEQVELEREQANQERLQRVIASAAFSEQDLLLQEEVTQDRDYTTFRKRYTEGATAALGESAKRIQDPMARAEFEAQGRLNIARGAVRVSELGRKIQKEESVAFIDERLSSSRELALRAADETQVQRLFDETDTLLQGAVESGVMSPVEAGRKWRAYKEDYAINRISAMPATARIQVLNGEPVGQEAALEHLIEVSEGGYVAKDGASGVAAIYGINRKWHPEAHDEALRLTQEKGEQAGKDYAKEFYRQEYWQRYNIDSLPKEVQQIVFDGAVNHRADFVQDLVEAAKAGATVEQIRDMRLKEYNRLAQQAPEKYASSLRGWENRVNQIAGSALAEDIPFEKRQELTRRAQVEMRGELAERVRDSDARASIGIVDANPLTLQDFTGAMGDEQGVRAYEGYIDQQRYAQSYSDVKIKTNEEQQALLQLYQPNNNSSADDLRRYGALRNAVDSIQKQRNNDPIQYALENNLAQGVAPLDLSADVAQQLIRRQDAAVSMRFTYGTPLRLVTQKEAKGIANWIKNTQPEQQASLLSNMADSLTTESYSALSEQLYEGGAPMAAYAGQYMNTKTREGLDLGLSILRGERLLNPLDGEKPTYKLPSNAGGVGIRVELDALYGKSLRNNPQLMMDAERAVAAVYADMAQGAGDYSSDWDTDRLDDALKKVLGEPVDMGESEVLPPWGMMEDDFKDRFNRQWDKKRKSQGVILPESYEDVEMVLAGNGKYRILSGTGYVLDMLGNPVTIDVLGD